MEQLMIMKTPEHLYRRAKKGALRRHRLLLLAIHLLVDRGHDIAKHDNAVAVEEGNAGEALAILEADDEGLLGLEGDLGHLVGLEGMGLIGLLAAGLLAHLPHEVADAAGGTAGADEANGGGTLLDLTGDIEGLDLGIEGGNVLEGAILLVDHDVTGAGHVLLVETLDIEADVVTGAGGVGALVVHLDGEHLTGADVGGGVGGHEHNFLTGLHGTLLHAAGEHITDTLDLVDTGDGHAHRLVNVALRRAGHLVEHIVEGLHVELLLTADDGDNDVLALPPVHVLGLLVEVVTHPAGDGHARDGLLNEVLLPADLHKHVLHLVADLIVAGLLVASGVAVHLVDANAELLDTEQVDQAAVLAGLALDLA